jgi:threonyl-tRNA synthetase
LRLLQLHTDFVEYEPISKENKDAEELVVGSKIRLEDIVVVLIAIEKNDDKFIVVGEGLKEVRKYLDLVKSERLLIYPYAHLSSDLADSNKAIEVIKAFEEVARTRITEVYRAPFGWTKGLAIKIKGHPLAESSRTITNRNSRSFDGSDSYASDNKQTQPAVVEMSSALLAEDKIKSSWFILDLMQSQDLIPVNEYEFTSQQENLQAVALYEEQGKRKVDQQPPHVKLMKKLAIADYEPASDAGNMRFYPKGRLMKSLIEQFVTSRVIEYGANEVETPIMYDAKHPALESYFNRFPARQYDINSDAKRLFLRFAACFGQFLMAKDYQISYKNLPLKLYELTRYSFRREKSGELVGLRRLRAFSMPDCHAFCRDLLQAREEILKRLELSISVLEDIGISSHDDVEMVLRLTEEFYRVNTDFVNEIVSRIKKPVLVELWNERFFYFVLKWELNFIDNMGKASALSTDQIDVENGLRYGIEFIDEDGSRKNPIILHNSPSGAIERVIYTLLEKAFKVSKSGHPPSIPLWLAHTQVRLIPVGREHVSNCERIAEDLSKNQIRVDIDERNESVAKRIREAEYEWIQYIIVLGDKEATDSSNLTVRDRLAGKQREIRMQEFVQELKAQTLGKPYLPLNLPRNLSKRPQIMV